MRVVLGVFRGWDGPGRREAVLLGGNGKVLVALGKGAAMGTVALGLGNPPWKGPRRGAAWVALGLTEKETEMEVERIRGNALMTTDVTTP